MNSRDKEKIQDKLKQFFKKKTSGSSRKSEFALTEDILKDLRRESPINVRTKTLQDIGENVLVHKLEEDTIATLWHHVKDLLGENQPKEVRDVGFTFLRFLIVGQYERLVNVMRTELFRFIKEHDVPEDLPQKFEMLHDLTANGKDLLYFEEEAGAFMLRWARPLQNYGKEEEYLAMLLNIIKFNASYLDDRTIMGIVREMYGMISNLRNNETIINCIQILDALLAYSNMSSASLPLFIGILCRKVNVKETCVVSWNVMKNLLGTHMGHKSIYIMCRILKDSALNREALLLRGAVFFIHTGLWSYQRITKLICPPGSILPAFLTAVKNEHPAVTLEVTIGIQRLVKTFYNILLGCNWELILQILSCAIQQIDHNSGDATIQMIVTPLHNTLDMIERYVQSNIYTGDIDHFYKVVEECILSRTDTSVYNLIDYQTKSISPFQERWLTNLYNLLSKYFRNDVRTNIKLKMLENLDQFMQMHRKIYEEELIDVIVIPQLSTILYDPEVMFRANAVRFLIDNCMLCDSRKCLEMLEILEKLLLQPFDDHNFGYKRTEESDFYDIVCLVSGLVNLFVRKMYKLPSSHAVKIYNMLVSFLEANYTHPRAFEKCSDPRFTIIECFLKMRADNKYRLGFPVDGILLYSPYLCITYKDKEKGPLGSPPPTSPAVSQLAPCTITYMNLRRVFKVFITSLKREKNWKILSHMLQELPKVLQNKNLILSKEGNKDVYLLGETLTALIMDRTLNLPETLNVKVSKPDFHSAVIQVLLNMASYHGCLPPQSQRRLIACLMYCIKTVNKSLKNCITALMVCALEMRETMMKTLPPVLLCLSQTSATQSSALPVLEFLSVLSQLPKVYSNFTGVQYMAIFAIALPYTNPFKYNNYIASLAHNVISTWFLKCRLPLRKEFVKYITTGLQTNVLIPFEEEKAMLRNEMKRLSELNQDSGDRKRSSSLTEQGRPRRRAATVSARVDASKPKPYLQKPSLNGTVLTFYQELTETCCDLMARYCFQQPRHMKRSSLSNYLLKRGQSMTWIIGRTVVTITTSGCSQNVLKNGVCETCWETVNKKESGTVSRQNSNERPENEPNVNSPPDENRRLADQTLDGLPNRLQEFIEEDDRYACPCWCMGWAEVHYRRPTGDMIFLMRISPEVLNFDVPLTGLTRTYLPFLNLDQELHEGQPTQQNIQLVQQSGQPTQDGHPAQAGPRALQERQPAQDEQQTQQGDQSIQLYGQPPQHEQSVQSGQSQQQDVQLQQDMLVLHQDMLLDRTEALPLPNLDSIDLTEVPGSPLTKSAPSRQSSKESVDEELDVVYDDGTTSRNPVRRSNSSPEMSASWKAPFLRQKAENEEDNIVVQEGEAVKKSKMYSKDIKVSCEAIPEEIAGMGTTPPKSSKSMDQPLYMEPQSVSSSTLGSSQHPSLLSCHSYPGSSPPGASSITPKPCQTVPASPNMPYTSKHTQPSFPARSLTFSKDTKSESLESSVSASATTSSSASSSDKGERPVSLTLLPYLPPLSGKPPQSPTQMSPRLPRHMLIRDREGHEIQKSSSSSVIERATSGLSQARDKARERKNTGSMERMSMQDVNQLQKRDRGHTVSVMSSSNSRQPDLLQRPSPQQPTGSQQASSNQQGSGSQQASGSQQGTSRNEKSKSGVSPSLIFIHMYHSAMYGFKGERALLVSDASPSIQRSLKILDCIPPYQTYTIGVIYIGDRQCNDEAAILRNSFGSARFVEFLQTIGSVIKLQEADPQTTYLGGLEQNGNDGKFAYIWEDDFIRIMFHVATMMPTKENDPKCTNKKKHIGNDSVVIVYNESGDEYQTETLKGQMNFASIIIEPLDHKSNRITIKSKNDLDELIGSVDPLVVSDSNVGVLTRQLALHYDLASQVLKSSKTSAKDPYSSNWLERLRKIKQVREKLLEEKEVERHKKYEDPHYGARLNNIEDITEYT